jgi:uncharacterized protein (TIGR03643 family)
MKSQAAAETVSQVIRYAREGRTSFEEIQARTGFTEAQIIEVMRR